MQFPTRIKTLELYLEILTAAERLGPEQFKAAQRKLCKEDLFFLLTQVCKRKDIEKSDWLFARIREVQADPDGFIDLWAREHYKSTIITFGLTIQNILNDPEITVGIASHTRPIAKAFLRQIKIELETNDHLRSLFPDILYANPKRDSPKWSEDVGIIVKRAANPKESTVEAWGLVDGQPVSRHYSLLVYDDVVTRNSVSNPDMIKKVTAAWGLSLALGAEGGKIRIIGTRYHLADTYKDILDRGAAISRIYAATHNGKMDGDPVFLTRESLAAKRKGMGPYIFACQMLQNPKADNAQGFKKKWLRYWPGQHFKNLNVYLFVDSANEKKKNNDFTAMWVIGYGSDGNKYILDIVRDRLNPTERTKLLFHLHRQYEPEKVYYEKYGKDGDIHYIKKKMEKENYRFKIQAVGGVMSKNDRIKMLIPEFEQGTIFLPDRLIRTNYEGVQEDLVKIFISEEYQSFPVASHDDMLDSLARMYDPKVRMKKPSIKNKNRPRRRAIMDYDELGA